MSSTPNVSGPHLVHSGATSCLEVPGNAFGIVRDVGKYLPVTAADRD